MADNSPTPEKGVAVFDFDGTLTKRDSLLGFLACVAGWPSVARALVALAGEAIRMESRDALKRSLIRHILRGRHEDRIHALGRLYAQRLVRKQLRKNVVERLQWHADQNHRLVVVSASLKYYVGPVASQIGVDVVLCTELDTNDDGYLSGEIRGRNTRGDEKVRRIEERLGPIWSHTWCYGNSAGDRPMLQRAAHSFLVSRFGKLIPVD